MKRSPSRCRSSCTGAAIALAVAACAQGEPAGGNLPAPQADAASADAARPVDAADEPDADEPDPADAADGIDAEPGAPDARPDARPDAAPPIDAAPDARVPDAAPPPDADPTGGVLFACNETELYRVDPVALSSTRVGAFEWPAGGFDAMADLAVAADGALYGASATRLYRIDPANARATLVGSLGQAVNALSFVPPGAVDSGETLVGATLGGAWLRIDRATAAVTTLGHFSGGHSSSGDLAHVPGVGVVALVNPGGPNDTLVRVAPATGATTGIGASTGAVQVWGMAYSGGRLIGFTLARDIVTIDTATGIATRVTTGPTQWYGAGGR